MHEIQHLPKKLISLFTTSVLLYEHFRFEVGVIPLNERKLFWEHSGVFLIMDKMHPLNSRINGQCLDKAELSLNNRGSTISPLWKVLAK